MNELEPTRFVYTPVAMPVVVRRVLQAHAARLTADMDLHPIGSNGKPAGGEEAAQLRNARQAERDAIVKFLSEYKG